jgi:NADPH:quinone reductase-like Zn-dependent oxidoreductase
MTSPKINQEQPLREGAWGKEENSMKAIVQDEYGSPDVLELRDIDIPEIKDEEVLVRVHAAGVGRDVWHVMAGLPYPIRLAGYGLRAPKNPVIGSDMAGVVEAIGKNVSTFQPGDEVFGIGRGSYAEYARASQGKLAPKPENLTFEQAAVLAIMGSAALQALRDQGKVRPGQEVLIIGASGGVGTYAVQIAKAFGAHVTGVCSTSKVEMVRSIGADHIIDYKREDFAEGDQRYDVVLDIGGNSSVARLRSALSPRWHASGAPSPLRGPSSSSAARGEAGGSEASSASSGRRCCRRSWARSWARSSPRRTTKTC